MLGAQAFIAMLAAWLYGWQRQSVGWFVRHFVLDGLP